MSGALEAQKFLDSGMSCHESCKRRKEKEEIVEYCSKNKIALGRLNGERYKF